MTPLPLHGFVDTATVARHLSVSPSWVRANAATLGAVRLGNTARGGLRFDTGKVRAELDRRRVQAPTVTRRRRPGPKVGTGAIPADVRDW